MKKLLAIALSAVLAVAIAVPAMAAYYPSTEQSTDPHVKQQSYNGQSVDFLIYDDNGNVVDGTWSADGTKFTTTDKTGASATYELIVVSYNSRNGSDVPAEIKQALEDAYAQYKAGAYDSLAGSKVLNSLVYIGLKKTDASGNVSYVGVTDLQSASKMLIQFQDTYTLALTKDGDTYVKVNDGEFVKVGAAGVFALYKDQGSGSGSGTSPQTGYESQSGIVVAVSLVAALVAVVGVCYIADKKRA